MLQVYLLYLSYIAFFLFLMICILTHSALSVALAAKGLELWFQRMIPSLLPFMILSGTMVRMDITEGFTTLLYPVLKPLFQVRRNVCYVMIMGFLCGFPMGAKCVSELYTRGKLSRAEASYLLTFCNNIGPVYFVSFALPVIGVHRIGAALFGMYGLPFLYGLVLRYTVYRKISGKDSVRNDFHTAVPSTEPSFLRCLDDAILAALQSIAVLGGYMVLFNLLCMLPYLYLPAAAPYLAPLLEISGGLSVLQERAPVYSLTALVFGGFSCIAQTYTCIRETDLSLGQYMLHKCILTALCGGYYFFFLRFLRLL
ncbi:MAG: hypothetical protein IJ747_00575 [Lachnospiraceae bacterium]|nr:hypothetical protein [Lachnospiraceae bacterium]